MQRKQTANKFRKILHTSCSFQIKSPSIDLNVYYIDSLVSCQESCKYLGVYLDFKLNFLHHIRQVESKVAKAVGILSKLRFLLPKSTLLLLYHALIHPHLYMPFPSGPALSQITFKNFNACKTKQSGLFATLVDILLQTFFSIN